MAVNATRLMHITYSKNPITKKYEYYFRELHTEDAGFNPTLHFKWREMSAFWNHALSCDYIQMTWSINEESVTEAYKVFMEGLSSLTVPGFREELGQWEYLTCTARDHIKAIFVPKGLRCRLDEIGLKADLSPDGKKNSKQKAATFMKRLNRLGAPVEFDCFGSVISVEGDVYHIVTESGDILHIRVMPADVLVDGASIASPRGALILFGLTTPRHGDGVRITVCSEFGLAKGHLMVLDGLEYDAVLYGVKPELKYMRGFYAGRLSELHVGREPRTEIQSLINYFMPNDGLKYAADMFFDFFEEMRQAGLDSERFNRLMRRTLDKNPETQWLRPQATKLGLDACFPGLYRADISMLMSQVDKAKEAVVPMGKKHQRRYLMPSPFMFYSPEGKCDGTYKAEWDRLRGNCAVSSGLQAGETLIYRQPNGNCDEKWILDVVETPFKKLGKGEIIYLAADIIPQVMAACGGGDFDDPVICCQDQRIVDHVKTIPPYPKVEAAKLPDLQYEEPGSSFLPNTWDMRHAIEQIEDALHSTGIGTVVNAIMLDTCITLGKESMLQDLAAQIEALANVPEKGAEVTLELDRLSEAYHWLFNRPDYVLRSIASDLESRIDNIKMQGGQGGDDDQALMDDMYESTLVFPWCWNRGGFEGNGRIPARIQERNPVLAKTQLCQLYLDAAVVAQDVFQGYIQVEWMLVKPLPSELKAAFPRDPDIRDFIDHVREWWGQEWKEFREKGLDQDPKAVGEFYKRLVVRVDEGLVDSPFNEEREACAVELARQLYTRVFSSPLPDENGNFGHYGDGLLWTRPFGTAFLHAIEMAGLAGRIEEVELDTGIYFEKDETVPVFVKDGIVLDPENGSRLGTCKTLEDSPVIDGKKKPYFLQNRLIEVKACHPAFKQDWRLPDEQ